MLTIFSLEQIEARAIPLIIDRYHINIAVNNQRTKTKIDQIFVNPNDFDVEGIYIFPIADDETFSNFTLTIDGKPVTGELFSQQISDEICRASVQHSENSAILEHRGKRVFGADVPSIPANRKIHIQFEYSQIVPTYDDLAKYTYPLSLAKSASELIAELSVKMEIESDNALRTIYSPSHEVTINRTDDHHVHIRYKGKNVDPDDDFLCYYSVSDENFGITLLTHRTDEDEDGYFMLIVSPKYEVEKTDVIKKDFIFVLDHSGSMAGRKVEQAKEALRYCVWNLNEGDRFNLILFNTDITSLADRLNRQEGLSAALSHKLIDVKGGREKALDFIDGIGARGGTNINDALLAALMEKPDPNRPRIIVFLTDGCPTVGERNESRILENVAQANANQSRIFVFGVGYDVNVHLLDKMAADNGGTRNYVEPQEDIEIAVSSLFRKMNEPVLVNVELSFGQVHVKELSPQKLPDLFREEQMTLLGRYENHGDTDLQLWGMIGNAQHEFTQNVYFSILETDNDFLPHLWAQRRVTELVDQAALYGGSNELRKEIERISKKYGVETPITKFVTIGGTHRRIYLPDIEGTYDPVKPTDQAVRDSKEIEKDKAIQHKKQLTNTKYIGRKTFHQHGRIWVDNEYDGISKRKRIEIASKDFYDLMCHIPNLAKFTKIGLPMIICHGGMNYEITPRRSYKQA